MRNTTANIERIKKWSDIEIINKCKKDSGYINICLEVLLVRHNLLLWDIVWRYRSYINQGISEEDLYGEARLGFIVAFHKFDPYKGVKFTTYCYYWILQKVKRFIEYHGSIIRVPVHVIDSVNSVNKYGSVENASKETGKSVFVLEKALRNKDISVENIDDSLECGYIQEFFRADLFDFSVLDELEKAVIFSYFGFYCVPLKKNEICRVYGLSNKSFSVVLAGALGKLEADYNEKQQNT